MTNRIEQAAELKRLEEKKVVINENLKALGSSYLDKGEIKISLQTRDFNDKGNDDSFEFDKKALKAYLESELKSANDSIEEIVKQLYLS